MAKKPTDPKTFEDAIGELERILVEMERGEVPLEESLVRYERGNQLIQYCRGVLGKAEQQIEQMNKGDAPARADSGGRIGQFGRHAGDRAGDRRVTMVDVPSMLAGHAATVAGVFGLVADRTLRDAPPRLTEAVRYSFDAGGKRLRPALVYEAFAAATPTRYDHVARLSDADYAALAIELVHTFSLVHDDLPAMDDDDLRRGRPTNHKVFGEAVAILAGDAMTTLAFEALAAHASSDTAARLVAELARAAGPAGMIGGQVLDMAGEGKALDLAGLQAIHRKKTGALLTAACRMGAIAAGADAAVLAAVTAYGDHLGLAFQITDDVLDETATPEQLGKATRKDAGRGKNTYPRLLGLDAARRAAAEQVEAAVAALAPLGDKAERLAAVARFVGDRRA